MGRAASEWSYLRGLVRMLRAAKPLSRDTTRTFRDMADTVAARYGDRVALQSDRESLTFRGWNEQGTRYARWARDRGLAKGDVVALMMPNRPEYCAIWLGMARMGVVTALINTNLTGAALAHSLGIVGARLAIVDASLLESFEKARPFMDGSVDVVVYGDGPGGAPRIDREVAAFAGRPIPPEHLPPLTITDPCLYIYTSGTTGKPKAATVNHYRVQLIMHAFAAATRATAQDRIYDALPMYHTNGGVIAPGIALVSGGTCLIRERFSASEFWPDMVRHEATMFIYIGELCRYLLTAPDSSADRRHHVRLCVGNGLRPDVWPRFVDRFGVRTVIEYYAATEGNCTVFNLDSRPGSVGRIPPWIAHKFPVRVVRFDVDGETVVRGADGFCQEVAPGEPGELIGEIAEDPRKPGNRFDGYSDRDATRSKILTDAFKPGDRWFRTGDLVRRDKDGYFFFVDRVGDTFRWKGENVATSDVAEAISTLPGVQDVVVYGVAVPGREGRAGMAQLVADEAEGFDLDAFGRAVGERLPDYAVPVFLRFSEGVALTGTFKQRKTDLVADGFDLNRVADPLYMRDPATKRYQPLLPEDQARLLAGTGRV